MKPDVKALIQEAKQPPQHFVPARAGWNGPEESATAAATNPVLEGLRREPTPAQKRARWVAAATPDWRVWAAILLCIAALRALRFSHRRARLPQAGRVLAFPAVSMAKPAGISEAA